MNKNIEKWQPVEHCKTEWCNEPEHYEVSKHHYWRGFRACLLLIVTPLVTGVIILLNIFIKVYGN